MNKKVMKFIGDAKLGAKKYSPELLLGGALVAGTTTVVLASRATLKANDVTKTFHNECNDINADIDANVIGDEEAKDQVKKLYLKYAYELTKCYAIPAATYAATVSMMFMSYKIQKSRTIALSTALTACTTAYNTLVSRLKTGAMYGLTAKEVLDGVQAREVVDPETGEVTIEKFYGEAVTGLYEYRFDRYSPQWEPDKFQNEATLRGEENWANDILRHRGHIFLNEILDRLGLPLTVEGQFVGWRFNPDESVYIDFGTYDCELYDNERFDRNAFDLSFNVQGNILMGCDKTDVL